MFTWSGQTGQSELTQGSDLSHCGVRQVAEVRVRSEWGQTGVRQGSDRGQREVRQVRRVRVRSVSGQMAKGSRLASVGSSFDT